MDAHCFWVRNFVSGRCFDVKKTLTLWASKPLQNNVIEETNCVDHATVMTHEEETLKSRSPEQRKGGIGGSGCERRTFAPLVPHTPPAKTHAR